MPNGAVILGARGQVGRALRETLPGARACDRATVDLSRPETLDARLDELHRAQPITTLWNAAAYTQVDRAESEPALARAVNAEAPAALARWCAARKVPFIHFSTDYVYPGSASGSVASQKDPWRESDAVDPALALNVYGRTKLEGDLAVVSAGGRALIFRTSWVYDAEGANFLRTMLRLAREGKALRVVSDQRGAPTYAPQIARAAIRALERAHAQSLFPSGVYHLCADGETSWHAFAEAIFEGAAERKLIEKAPPVTPITTRDYPTPAVRPLDSRLDSSRFRSVFGLTLPDWREGLTECLDALQTRERHAGH